MISKNFYIFKVLFKAFEYFENKNMSLSFKNINSKNPIIIPKEILVDLKNLSEKNSDIIFIQNI